MAIRYLKKIEGLPGRFNNLIHVAAVQVDCANSSRWPIVCYFGGDIQNFKQEMILQKNHSYLQYSLETVASKLSKIFPADNIVVIQPSSTFESFSRYENFVKSIDRLGTPKFDCQDQSCYDHLEKLLENVHRLVGHSDNISTIEVKLIAFSKGQVVINQLARSLKFISQKQIKSNLLKFKEIYFLDGGHNGSSDIWINDTSLIDSLIADGGCEHFHIGVTDFQLNKSQFCRDEYKRFLEILNSRRSSLKIDHVYLEQQHHPNLTGIQLHFKLLDFLLSGNF